MKKYVLIYGIIVGLILAIVLVVMVKITPMEGGHQLMSMVWGYVLMLLPMTLIFVGVRAYRQKELGGIITFGRAFLCGLYISLIASVFYVASWEVYVNTFAADFIDQYTQCQIDQLKIDGVTGESLSTQSAELLDGAKMYKENALYRMALTFMEIVPVGILASLVSALILRKRRDGGVQTA